MEENFKNIKTIDDAFSATGRKKVDFSNVPEDMRTFIESIYNATVITEALNKGKKPNWNKSSEEKWIPWFYMSPSGFAFSDAVCDYSFAIAGSGSRLYNSTREIAEYSAIHFSDIWKGVQLG
jgi:hypothetical protein